MQRTAAGAEAGAAAALKTLLAEGEALRVEGPEHKNLRFAIAQQVSYTPPSRGNNQQTLLKDGHGYNLCLTGKAIN